MARTREYIDVPRAFSIYDLNEMKKAQRAIRDWGADENKLKSLFSSISLGLGMIFGGPVSVSVCSAIAGWLSLGSSSVKSIINDGYYGLDDAFTYLFDRQDKYDMIELEIAYLENIDERIRVVGDVRVTGIRTIGGHWITL